MDTDYSTLEKQMKDLDDKKYTFIEKYNTALLQRFAVDNLNNPDSISNQLKDQLSTLKHNKIRRLKAL